MKKLMRHAQEGWVVRGLLHGAPLNCSLALLVMLFPACSSSTSSVMAPSGSGLRDSHYRNLRQLAARKLGCPVTDLSYERVDDDLHKMSEGSRFVLYWLQCRGMCNWREVPFEQASFDLNCPEDKLEIKVLSQEQLGFSGCNKRARYALINNTLWVANLTSAEAIKYQEEEEEEEEL